MAKSLRGLIEFLLEEISLRGDQGVAASDVLDFIDHFYAQSQNGESKVSHGRPANDASRVHKVDQRFKSHVWTWLAKHPEVSIGKNREGNGLSLAEIVAGSERNGDDNSNVAPKQNEELRVFVSIERMWLAITGHEPDSSRVLPLEFALLSIIASRKTGGMVQSDLVRLSGQDKRSVPQRTDSLHQKGYIEKKAIQYKATRTSLCTLAKFAGSNEAVSYAHPSPDGTTSELNKHKIIDFSVLLTKLFTFLKEFQVISRDDLKRKMEMQDRWHGKILRRAIQKLEAIGCVRRVRAISQYHKLMKSHHASIMLIREPTPNDIRLFHDDISSLVTSLEAGGVEDEELAQDEAVEGTPEIDPLLQDGSSKEEFVVDASRKSPQWNPDRNLPNIIFDVVNGAGTNGINNQNTTTEIMGIFFRRPLEATLSRLTEHWQISQPLHLRHLAIVRDSALRGTVYHYVHYSFENFASLVNNGESCWEVVESRPISGKNAPKALAVDAKPTLDKYGFPIGDEPAGLLKRGNATLRQCLEAVKPWAHTPLMRGPAVVKRDDGSYGLELVRAQRGRSAAHLADRPPKRNHDAVDSPQSSPAPYLLGEDRSLSTFKRRVLAKLGNDPKVSEKERLEALGLDETWTEYNVLLIERPTPGLYITPQGKRRPARKRQGRPGKSRIAVFKLPKLKELDWFTAGEPELPVVDPSGEVENASVRVSEDIPSKTQRPRPKRAATRDRVYKSPTPDSQVEDRVERDGSEIGQDDEFEVDEETPKVPTPKKKRKRKSSGSETMGVSRIGQEAGAQQSKRQRLSRGNQVTPEKAQEPPAEPAEISTPKEAETVGDADVEMPPSSAALEGQMEANTQQNAEQVSTQSEPRNVPHELNSHEQIESLSEAIGSTTHIQPGIDEPQAQKPDNPLLPADGEELDEQMQGTPAVPEKEKTPEPPVELQTAEASSNATLPVVKHRKKREMRGGSVLFLRKKIMLDILDKAGGLYPLGTELWYPFTTSWLKTKQTEKPDMRTIRNTAKSLIEAGKLRQFTFSGRNPKGIVVTKSILAYPEMEPDGQATLELQRAMLDADPLLFFPPGVDIDPSLKKSNRTLAGHSTKLPAIEGEIKVMLHRPPAQARPRSERRRISRPIGGAEALLNLSLERHAHRLKTIRRSAQGRSYLASTSYSAREDGSFLLPSSLPPMVSKRWLLKFHSKMNDAASMLMSPPQAFHALSGTFGTGVSLFGISSRVSSKSKYQHAQYRLPSSLKDAVALLGDRRVGAGEGQDLEHFFYDVDIVKQWEHENPSIIDVKDGDHHFINHVMEGTFNSVALEGDIRFGSDGVVPSRRAPRIPMREKLSIPHKPGAASSRDHDPGDTRTPRRLTQLQGQKPGRLRTEGTQRATREITTIPKSMERRLLIALAVMRALAGGMEGRMVDWNLLAPMFPDYSLKFIHDRGRFLVAKHRLQLAKMQSDFQEKFLEAYEKSQVPPIDYNNLEAYDWEGVVNWAEKNLERPSTNRQLSLPATRKQFDSLFEIRKLPSQNIDEIYQHNTSKTMPRKRAIYSTAIFASTLPQNPASANPRPPHAQLLELAKTWVRANIVTPEEEYRGAEARQTLQRFADDLIDEAVYSLIMERVISQGNKGRIVPGRNFDLTEQFLMALTRKRAIESIQLKRAAHFKTAILDPALQSDGKFTVQYSAEDGDILVLTNLIAQGHLIIVPKNPPRNKYGLTDGGYLTRMMDKEKLRFEVEVHLVPDLYCYGNPIEQPLKQTTIPRGELNESINPTTAFVLPNVPLWLDVHGQFVKIIWELVVAAVLGIIAARPGVGIKVIKRMLEPCLAEWELELVLGWMMEVGIVQSTGDKPGEFASCRVEEWWWMSLAE